MAEDKRLKDELVKKLLNGEFDVPTLEITPIPRLDVDKVNVDFDMEADDFEENKEIEINKFLRRTDNNAKS